MNNKSGFWLVGKRVGKVVKTDSGYEFNFRCTSNNTHKNRKYNFNTPILVEEDIYLENQEALSSDSYISLEIESYWNDDLPNINPYRVVDVRLSNTALVNWNKTTKRGLIKRVDKQPFTDGDVLVSFVLNCEDEKYKCFFFKSDENHDILEAAIKEGKWEFNLCPRNLSKYDSDKTRSIPEIKTIHDRTFYFEVTSYEELRMNKADKIAIKEKEEAKEDDYWETHIKHTNIPPIDDVLKELGIDNPTMQEESESGDNKIFEEMKSIITSDQSDNEEEDIEEFMKEVQLVKEIDSMKDSEIKKIFKAELRSGKSIELIIKKLNIVKEIESYKDPELKAIMKERFLNKFKKVWMDP